MWKVTVNEELCKKCGICIAFCPTQVYTKTEDGGPIFFNQEKCTGCNLCVYRCPEIALTLTGGKEDDK